MANQVLSDVVATALGRWRHGFDWILRGYTYEARVPPGVGVADGGERCAYVGDIFRVGPRSLRTSRTWQPTVNKLESKILLSNRGPFPKST